MTLSLITIVQCKKNLSANDIYTRPPSTPSQRSYRRRLRRKDNARLPSLTNRVPKPNSFCTSFPKFSLAPRLITTFQRLIMIPNFLRNTRTILEMNSLKSTNGTIHSLHILGKDYCMRRLLILGDVFAIDAAESDSFWKEIGLLF